MLSSQDSGKNMCLRRDFTKNSVKLALLISLIVFGRVSHGLNGGSCSGLIFQEENFKI